MSFASVCVIKNDSINRRNAFDVFVGTIKLKVTQHKKLLGSPKKSLQVMNTYAQLLSWLDINQDEDWKRLNTFSSKKIHQYQIFVLY